MDALSCYYIVLPFNDTVLTITSRLKAWSQDSLYFKKLFL